MAEGKIRILATSRPYPSSLICYNKEVDPIILKAVKAALLSFDPKKEQVVDWDKTEMPNGFTEFNESSMRELRSLVNRYGLLR